MAVGNMTTGGTGKTPTVIYLSKLVEGLGKKAGVILRGYGAKGGQEADEVLLMRRHLPGVPIAANPDRIAGGKRAMAMGAEVIIADDAYQHRRLGRDLNLCLVDAVNPFGGGKVLPAGRLREPMEGLARADVVMVTRCDQVEEETIHEIARVVRRYAGEIPIITSSHRASGCADLLGNRFSVSELAGKKVFGMAGIGQPGAFFETLRGLGAEVVGTRAFRDHHRFTAEDLRAVWAEAEKFGAEILMCTEKDMVKLEGAAAALGIAGERVAAIEIEIAMSAEDEGILRGRVENVMKEFSREKLAGIE
jgi:tetraacyldisaccharide 4'-kinase